MNDELTRDSAMNELPFGRLESAMASIDALWIRGFAGSSRPVSLGQHSMSFNTPSLVRVPAVVVPDRMEAYSTRGRKEGLGTMTSSWRKTRAERVQARDAGMVEKVPASEAEKPTRRNPSEISEKTMR